jgi:predicted regulator of Ras-like GTPase activity (Roadblock/LC7/MglB family)
MSTLTDSVRQLQADITGAIATAIVNGDGELMAAAGSGINMALAAAGNSEVVRAKLKTMKSLGLNDHIEDIVITLGKQYHLIHPLPDYEGSFIYVVMERTATLAMARHQVQQCGAKLII